MKYIIILSILIISCGRRSDDIEMPNSKVGKVIMGSNYDTFYMIEIDSCEYIVYNGSQKGGIIHSENCKNHKK